MKIDVLEDTLLSGASVILSTIFKYIWK